MRHIKFVVLVIGCLAVLSCSNALQNRKLAEVTSSEDNSASAKTARPAASVAEQVAQSAGVSAHADAITAGSKRGLPDEARITPVNYQPEQNQPAATVPIDRKIIRNADFTIVTKNPVEDQRKIQSLAESLGGFVVTSEMQQSTNTSGNHVSVSITMRVPSAQFQKAIDELRKTGKAVIRDKITGQDVTEEYVDLEARLRAKKALENQFLEIMKQAKKVEDALSVQTQISEVRTEIERIEGRRRYLDNQASLSTITITLQTDAPLIAATQTSFWSSVRASFSDGADLTVGIVLGFIHFLIVAIPIFCLIILPLLFIGRIIFRKFGWSIKSSHQPTDTKIT